MKSQELFNMFKNGNYIDVLANTTTTKNIDDLFLRAISFAMINNYQDAIKTIKENEQILKNDFSRLIDTHMDICFWAGKFLDAQKAIQHYEEYPYVSQEVEEKFIQYKAEIDKRIEELTKSSYNEEDLINMLSSSKDEEVQLGLNEIKKFEILPYLNALQNVLISKKLNASTRCLALILLYEKKYKLEVKYNWHGEELTIIPADLKTPFEDPKFNNLLKMKESVKDVAYSQTFETLLATYYLYMYPRNVDLDVEDLFSAFDVVTRKYISWPQNKMRQKPQVENLISKIEEINKIF